jgi:hypothetical protein
MDNEKAGLAEWNPPKVKMLTPRQYRKLPASYAPPTLVVLHGCGNSYCQRLEHLQIGPLPPRRAWRKGK